MKIEWGVMGPKGTKKLTFRYLENFARMDDFYARVRWYTHPLHGWTVYYRKLEKGELE